MTSKKDVAALIYRIYEETDQDKREHLDSFNTQLFQLFLKADWENKNRLRDSFPEFCDTVQEWYDAEDRFAFYRKYGVSYE